MHSNNPTDRSALIRLAATLPRGSEERRSILAGLGKVQTGVLRDPFYKLSDGLYALKGEVQDDPQLRQDSQLLRKIEALMKDLNNLHRHLESTYIWD